MYTQQDLTDIRAQIKRRWLTLIPFAAVLLIAIIVFVILRQEPLTIAATILLGALLIAGYDLFIKPLRCYERMLNGVLNGPNHVMDDGAFAHLDEQISMVEGVAYYAMTVSCTDEKGKPAEHLYYLDAQKARPDFAVGTPLHIIYHDRTLRLVEAR